MRYALLALFACLVLGVLAFSYFGTFDESPTVFIGGEEIRVDVVDTPSLRAQGLSGRSSLAPGQGMLFVFPTNDRHAFWMKDMHFSIDIIWISREGRVVHVAQNVAPESYPASFTPDAPAGYVLEVPAGFAEMHGVKEGDAVELLL